jgi:hypothetical protein
MRGGNVAPSFEENIVSNTLLLKAQNEDTKASLCIEFRNFKDEIPVYLTAKEAYLTELAAYNNRSFISNVFYSKPEKPDMSFCDNFQNLFKDEGKIDAEYIREEKPKLQNSEIYNKISAICDLLHVSSVTDREAINQHVSELSDIFNSAIGKQEMISVESASLIGGSIFGGMPLIAMAEKLLLVMIIVAAIMLVYLILTHETAHQQCSPCRRPHVSYTTC